MEWNRDVASIIQLTLVILFFILLLIYRKKLGKEIIYFIIASAIVAGVDSFIFVMRLSTSKFNSTPAYSIGINLFVFLFYFVYFRKVLKLKQSRKLNSVLIVIFLACYILFAIFSQNFFTTFSVRFYFIEVILLVCNIFLVLRETFNSDKILNIKPYYPFWACIGLMAIYLGVTPLLIISNTAMEMMNINIFFIILFFVNVIGYSILITGVFFSQNILQKSESLRN